MNFSKTSSYALQVLTYLAGHEEELFSAKYLHEKLNIPKQYLRQLLTSLAKNDLIKSVQGRSGGFCLCRNADEIFLADIIDAIDGLDSLQKCIMGYDQCPFDQSCAMHDIWDETRDNIIHVLKTTSLGRFRKTPSNLTL